jgi:hypothetical protein
LYFKASNKTQHDQPIILSKKGIFLNQEAVRANKQRQIDNRRIFTIGFIIVTFILKTKILVKFSGIEGIGLLLFTVDKAKDLDQLQIPTHRSLKPLKRP